MQCATKENCLITSYFSEFEYGNAYSITILPVVSNHNTLIRIFFSYFFIYYHCRSLRPILQDTFVIQIPLAWQCNRIIHTNTIYWVGGINSRTESIVYAFLRAVRKYYCKKNSPVLFRHTHAPNRHGGCITTLVSSGILSLGSGSQIDSLLNNHRKSSCYGSITDTLTSRITII